MLLKQYILDTPSVEEEIKDSEGKLYQYLWNTFKNILFGLFLSISNHLTSKSDMSIICRARINGVILGTENFHFLVTYKSYVHYTSKE